MSESYNCAICHDIFVEPTILPCGHTYCAMCIKYMKNKKCAVDKKSFKNTAVNYTLQSIIDETYKDNAEYKKRIQSLQYTKLYEDNLKYISKSQEFIATYRIIVDKLRSEDLDTVALVGEFGKVLTWTCLDKIMKETDILIRCFGRYIFTHVGEFITVHHDEMSKSDILTLVNPENHNNRQMRKIVSDMLESDKFIKAFNEHMILLKPQIEKQKTIETLYKKVSQMRTVAYFMDYLNSPRKVDVKNLLEALDIDISTIYNSETKKWSKNVPKCRKVYIEYEKQIKKYITKKDDDSSEESDSEESNSSSNSESD